MGALNLVMYQLMFACLSIRERFKCLNQNLSYYFPTGILQCCDKKFEGLKALNIIVDLHDQLAEAILLVNSTFTFQVTYHFLLQNI